MNQVDDPNQNVGTNPYPGSSQQGVDPYQYPASYYPQPQQPAPQQPYQSPQVPYQTPIQPTVGGATPEAPTRTEMGEQYVTPEVPVQVETGKERVEQVERVAEKQVQKPDVAKEDREATPDQKKFESPFKVYGYQASPKMVAKGQKSSSQSVKGNTSLAKTWLVVLLGRLLRLHPREALQAS